MSSRAKRHFLATRLWHWTNLAAVVILFMSGLNISNGHPRLYWGASGFDPATAWLEVPRFPGWATIPNFYSLAAARDWHNLFAWVFAVSLLLMWIASLVNGHVRDLVTRRREWRPSAIWQDVKAHLRLDFEHGRGKYNFLQKLSYIAVLGIMIPVLILTGMMMSPGWEPQLWPLMDLIGGRQTARSVHFITAWALFAFFVVHVILVILSGPIWQLRSMITGAERAT